MREIGRELGCRKYLERHPFPGPGLAIRCLCSAKQASLMQVPEGWILPIRSVGVQGDSRSYHHALVVDHGPTQELIKLEAPALTNRLTDINRVVAACGSKAPLSSLKLFEAYLTKDRLGVLRRADAIVRRFQESTRFEDKVWQFPVVLLPIGTIAAPESVVLRPIDSIDGMTAEAVLMDPDMLQQLTQELLALSEVGAVFYDVTNKPPGTIEWE